MSSAADGQVCTATVLSEADPDHRRILSELRSDPGIAFVDRWDAQVDGLRGLRGADDTPVEAKHWAYYPWRRTVTSVLGPRGFRTARLDRNRNLITVDEQDRLAALRIGVIGLSVGHAVAHTLAQEGLCGFLRLADFDTLELTNLNRVPAAILDVGLNKATAAARRIAELDPYLPVETFTEGVTAETIDEFLDGIDVLVEECDSLDTKVLVRDAARARRIPVLMATSDRGLVDVERFDLEPNRPLMHGLLGDVDVAELATLSSKDKVPHALRMLDATAVSSRMAASLVEVGKTLTTWPQLVGEVALGATLVAEAVRRIGLGEELSSGRVRVDVRSALDGIVDPAASQPATSDLPETHVDETPTDAVEAVEAVEAVVAAAVRAPSGGNVQPWRVAADAGSVTISLAPEYTSTMDVGFRGSAVAIGAAAFNARVAAAAKHILGPVEFESGDDTCPLRAVLRLADGSDPVLARMYEPMLARETNRHRGQPTPLPGDLVDSMRAAARAEGARLHMLTGDDLRRAAEILAESDRIRYLTPRLHAEMFSELRWPQDPMQDSGLALRTLELSAADLVTLDILKRPEVMAHLAEWDLGAALGDDTRDRVLASSCVAVISTRGQQLTDYARAGSAVEAVWILANQHGFAVQPISPVFLYAHDVDDLAKLSPAYAPALQHLRARFRELTAMSPDDSQALVLRITEAPATSVRSRRRRAGTSNLLA